MGPLSSLTDDMVRDAKRVLGDKVSNLGSEYCTCCGSRKREDSSCPNQECKSNNLESYDGKLTDFQLSVIDEVMRNTSGRDLFPTESYTIDWLCCDSVRLEIARRKRDIMKSEVDKSADNAKAILLNGKDSNVKFSLDTMEEVVNMLQREMPVVILQITEGLRDVGAMVESGDLDSLPEDISRIKRVTSTLEEVSGAFNGTIMLINEGVERLSRQISASERVCGDFEEEPKESTPTNESKSVFRRVTIQKAGRDIAKGPTKCNACGAVMLSNGMCSRYDCPTHNVN